MSLQTVLSDIKNLGLFLRCKGTRMPIFRKWFQEKFASLATGLRPSLRMSLHLGGEEQPMGESLGMLPSWTTRMGNRWPGLAGGAAAWLCLPGRAVLGRHTGKELLQEGVCRDWAGLAGRTACLALPRATEGPSANPEGHCPKCAPRNAAWPCFHQQITSEGFPVQECPSC